VREDVQGVVYSHGFVSDWMVILGLMVGFTSVKFEAENLAVAVLFCGAVVDWAGRTVDEVDVETVEVVLEEVGAVWDNPAKRRVTSVVEKNILMNFQAVGNEGGFSC
jgi:hypothetical protein